MSDDIDKACIVSAQFLDVAIERITNRYIERPDEDENGRYCLDCGCVIEKARLHVLPEAVRCIDCQSLKERR